MSELLKMIVHISHRGAWLNAFSVNISARCSDCLYQTNDVIMQMTLQCVCVNVISLQYVCLRLVT